MLKKNDIIEITIDDISIEGAGIERLDGQIVFVAKALPGERVKVKIIKAKKSFAVGLLQQIVAETVSRVTPLCGVFGKCGGCTLQHLNYEEQVTFKANHIKQSMKRLGGIDIELPDVLAQENTRHYRNKAAFPVAQIDGRVQAGFYAVRSHRVVPSDCAIQSARINEVKNVVVDWANDNGIIAYEEKTDKGVLRHIVVRESSVGEVMVGVVSTKSIVDERLIAALKKVKGVVSIVQNINDKKTNAILGEKNITMFGEDYITEQYEDLKFRAALPSFLQVNHAQTQRLYKIALEFADIQATDVVFDLFCGIGTISLLAAKRAKTVVGIEYVQSAVDNAEQNAKLNEIINAQFIAGDAGERLADAQRMVGAPDTVIIDPPRKGCDADLVDKICEIAPRRIVYVSCNPATLARDAALFAEQGYTVENVKGVDMFAHTTHVESVARLSR
ncbi:MAG: 23S rRNA (uracil(1939)-C(5))-methyltransferase RlmD [Clostridia bacterium]|jgi:23S rRNA (uracil1939-C5)-methyltransferase|nr:23S rRNA (uracil(1939)-C(5))-methyltransferase RlmD [Clostridia bacterium]MBT7121654.1 23S rRNA (uracil(1939)-C(5))-methyltransferase RlmD [Clostridia bacterium]